MGAGAASPRKKRAPSTEGPSDEGEAHSQYTTYEHTTALRDMSEADDDGGDDDAMSNEEHEMRLAAQRERNRVRASDPARFADARRARQSQLNASRKAKQEREAEGGSPSPG